MSYTKNTWIDQDVERPKTYEVTNNQDGSITLTDSFGLVTELGTPVNAVNMNHIEDGIANCADIDLANLSDEGESHFLGKPQITNCILEAPNGVCSVNSSTGFITIKEGLKVLAPNGRNADGTLKNVEYIVESEISDDGSALTHHRDCVILLLDDVVSASFDTFIPLLYFISDIAPTTTESGQVAWFNPNDNKLYYKWVNNGVTTWTEFLGVVIAKNWTYKNNTYSVTPFNTVNLATKDEIDGMWVVKKAELNTSTAQGTYAIDLSTILPQDSNTYELLLTLATSYAGTAAVAPTVYVYGGSYIDESKPIYAAQVEAYSRVGRNTFIYIIRSGEILYKKINFGNASDCRLHLYAYRKVR